MDHIITYESYQDRYTIYMYKVWHNAKVGQTLPESDIYQFIEQLHANHEDMTEGDLGHRIEQYSEYKLREIDLDQIDLEEWYWNESVVAEYVREIERTGKYPPIVMDDNLGIIDGMHRANAVKESGDNTILAWVGQGSSADFLRKHYLGEDVV